MKEKDHCRLYRAGGALACRALLALAACPALGRGLDIEPGSCPNPLNTNPHSRHGNDVVPAALVGTHGFAVARVDVRTLRLSRADGVGGIVVPAVESPVTNTAVGDVAAPYQGELCGCHELEDDGILDLSMTFKRQDLIQELELHRVPSGGAIELVLKGALADGTTFLASDCIVVVPPSDLDGDGAVNAADLLVLFGAWGPALGKVARRISTATEQSECPTCWSW